MARTAFDRDRLGRAFELLGRDLPSRGVLLELAVHGGRAILLHFAWRKGTGDVDAVLRPGCDERLLAPSAARVAALMDLPDRAGMRGFLIAVSPVAFRTRLIFTGPDPLQRARFPHGRGTVTFPAAYPGRSDGAGDP